MTTKHSLEQQIRARAQRTGESYADARRHVIIPNRRQPQVVLLRVGIDYGAGGIQGPLFANGSFELVPIYDGSPGCTETRRTW